MDGLFSCIGASSSYNQNNVQLSMMRKNLPNCASQRPIGVGVVDGFQGLLERKSLLSSVVDFEGFWPVSRVRTCRPCRPITCSYGIGVDATRKNTAQPCLVPFFGGAHGYKSTSLHRRIYSNSGQTSTRDACVDDSGPEESGEESTATVTTALHHVSEAVGAQSCLQRIVPENLWPYAQLARVEKPIGIWLVAWPCFWSTCLAAPVGAFPNLEMIGLVGLWAFLMRGAACTVNDMLDRDFDREVERTRSRPFSSGTVTLFQGVSFLVLQVVLGLAVTLPLNGMSRLLGALFVILFLVYPLMKRVTYWPQAFLGLAINFGSLFAWAAVRGNLDLYAVLPLYASGILWTLVYDTIYAHQDKEDDRKIGVKSTALLFGDKTRIILTGFSLGSLALLALAGFNCGLGWPFYGGALAASGHLAWQLGVDLDDPADCNFKFQSNIWYGAIVCSAIIAGKLAASSI